MHPEDFFRLKMAPAEFPPHLRLRPVEWTVLVSLDGQQSVGQTLKRFGLEREQLEQMLQRFQEAGLVERMEVTWAEYQRTYQAAPPVEVRPTVAPKPPLPRFTPLPLPLRPTVQAKPAMAPTPTVSVTPAGLSTTTVAPAGPAGGRKLNLRAVMDYIIRQNGGDQNAGQLAVYRVFMRLDTKLLRRNGISSLRFQDDRLVQDAELEAALGQSMQAALGVTLPEEAYA